MGIQKLMEIIRQHAPNAIKKRDPLYFDGNKFACDASMAIYQFLIQTQMNTESFLTTLTDEQGNKTGHLLGLWNRTIGMLEHGIKPVWVFDGKPPQNKQGQIMKRTKRKKQAAEKFQQAKQTGDLAQALKQKKMTTKISLQERDDAVQMLKLMGNQKLSGIPIIMAPSQAEAQCSYMAKKGAVDAVVTQDMDALTFGATRLIRQIQNINKKEPLIQIDYQVMLKEFQMTHEQFVDMCILCGCDYLPRIQGIGPMKAFKFIKEHKSLQEVLKHLQSQTIKTGSKKKYLIPNEYENLDDIRHLFLQPKVIDDYQLKWDKNFDEELLKKFLIENKGFNQARVNTGIKKLKLKVEKSQFQPRLEAFFGKPTVIKSNVKVQSSKKDKSKSKKK